MRTPTLLLTATLALAACSEDGARDDGDAPSAEQKDAGPDAQRPDTMDAKVAEDAAGRADATLPGDAALVGEPDAQLASDAAGLDANLADATLEDAAQTSDASPPDAGPPVCDPRAAPVVGKLGLQAVISGGSLSYLTEANQPPGSDDWYLVQQNGVIRVLQNGVLREQPFLDLRAEITLANDLVYEDRGLVSIEFAPDYASSGLFYVAITPNLNPSLLGGDRNLDQVRSYRRSAADPYVADASTRVDILSLKGSHVDAPSDYTTNIHNGGRIAFGPDGMLYVAMGDGGGINCGDSEPNATQDIGTLFGKLLRLDLSKPAPHAAADNPFVQDGDPRVLHYGLRNPFRFSFDRLTGDLYIGDVGQNRFEEVSFAAAGAKGLNFGWAHFEGASNATCGALRPLRPGSTHTAPIVSIERGLGATGPFADYNAMIGGVVYRGSALPQLQGIYFFGGYRGARLGALRQCGTQTSPITPVAKSCNPNAPNESCLRSLNGAPALSELRAIVEDHAGEMYVVANRNTFYKVVALP